MYPVTVILEGISPDLTTANGAYGEQARYGLSTPQELVDFFTRVQPLALPPGGDGCPPVVTMATAAGEVRYLLDGGRIFSEGSDAFVTPQQIAEEVGGPGKAADSRKKTQRSKGLQPVRMPHVAPTVGVTPNIDSGPHQPQVAFPLYVSDKAKWGPLFWGGLGTPFCLFGLFAMVNGAPMAGVFALIALGVLMIGGAIWYHPRTRAEVRYGFDWSTNTMWCIYGPQRRLGFVANANLITHLDFMEFQEVAETGGVQRSWVLEAVRVDGKKHTLGPTIYTKAERAQILSTVGGLLDQQC